MHDGGVSIGGRRMQGGLAVMVGEFLVRIHALGWKHRCNIKTESIINH